MIFWDPGSGKSIKNLSKICSKVDEKNLNSILRLWQARSYDKGSKVQVTDNKGKINSGSFLGLDEIGGLIFRENTGVKKIYSGDVYFGS